MTGGMHGHARPPRRSHLGPRQSSEGSRHSSPVQGPSRAASPEPRQPHAPHGYATPQQEQRPHAIGQQQQQPEAMPHLSSPVAQAAASTEASPGQLSLDMLGPDGQPLKLNARRVSLWFLVCTAHARYHWPACQAEARRCAAHEGKAQPCCGLYNHQLKRAHHGIVRPRARHTRPACGAYCHACKVPGAAAQSANVRCRQRRTLRRAAARAAAAAAAAEAGVELPAESSAISDGASPLVSPEPLKRGPSAFAPSPESQTRRYKRQPSPRRHGMGHAI